MNVNNCQLCNSDKSLVHQYPIIKDICNHNFCVPCLVDVYLKHKNQRVRLGCPTCRLEISWLVNKYIQEKIPVIKMNECQYCLTDKNLVYNNSKNESECKHKFCIPCLINIRNKYPDYDILCPQCRYSIHKLIYKSTCKDCKNCHVKFKIETICEYGYRKYCDECYYLTYEYHSYNSCGEEIEMESYSDHDDMDEFNEEGGR